MKKKLMTHRGSSIIILLLLFAQHGISQIVQPDFNIVRGTSTFTLGKVNSIAQDKYGYMWFADQTNKCLARYDGMAGR
jgi:ligand-binding sensor domain-containing protein